MVRVQDMRLRRRNSPMRGRAAPRASQAAEAGGPRAPGGGQASALLAMPFSFSSAVSSPDWNISITMSQPPTNSPFT